jgi:hypothetical protein
MLHPNRYKLFRRYRWCVEIVGEVASHTPDDFLPDTLSTYLDSLDEIASSQYLIEDIELFEENRQANVEIADEVADDCLVRIKELIKEVTPIANAVAQMLDDDTFNETAAPSAKVLAKQVLAKHEAFANLLGEQLKARENQFQMGV